MSVSGSADENADVNPREADSQQLPGLQYTGDDQLEELDDETGDAEKQVSEATESSAEAFNNVEIVAGQDEIDAAANDVNSEQKHDTCFQTDHHKVDLGGEAQPAAHHTSSSMGQNSGSRSNSKVSTKRDRKRKHDIVHSDEDGHDSSREDLYASAGVGGDESGTIPIFTREFLIHNKQQEVSLRNLRKEINDVEDERGNLQRHLELLEQETTSLRKEMDESRQLNTQLERAQDLIVEQIAEALLSASVELPETDLRSKTSRLQAARKYVRLCVSQAAGTSLSALDCEFVQTLRRRLSALVVTC